MGNRFTVYNAGITDSYPIVREDNKKLITEYLKYCKSYNKSPDTLYQYEQWLKVFFSWNYKENGDKLFFDLKRKDFIYYISWLREKNMSPKRINSLKNILSSMSDALEILYEDEYPTFHNIARSIKSVDNADVREKTIYKLADVQNMLSTLVSQGKYQTACFLAVACGCGARRSELIQMKTSFFAEDHETFNGLMYVTDKIRSKGRGVQGKIIQKYCFKDFIRPYFDLWMKERERRGIESEYLFVTTRDGKCSQAKRSTADSMAQTISKLCNIAFYPHSARHFFCTYLKSLHWPDSIIKTIFSWESADLIKTYNDISDEEELKEFFEGLQKSGMLKGMSLN